MPDIREILNALSADDRALWTEQRMIMRRSYLNAHNSTVGMANWSHEDDAFLDLIDIRLALLFDRAGLLNATKQLVDVENGHRVEKALQEAEESRKKKVEDEAREKYKQAVKLAAPEKAKAEPSEASLQLEGWKSAIPQQST